MVVETIKVKPSTASDAVRVATDEVNNTHYPIYKLAIGADGEARLVDKDNPLHILEGIDNTVSLHADLHELITQQKITNLHLAIISGQLINKGDLDD